MHSYKKWLVTGRGGPELCSVKGRHTKKKKKILCTCRCRRFCTTTIWNFLRSNHINTFLGGRNTCSSTYFRTLLVFTLTLLSSWIGIIKGKSCSACRCYIINQRVRVSKYILNFNSWDIHRTNEGNIKHKMILFGKTFVTHPTFVYTKLVFGFHFGRLGCYPFQCAKDI